MVVNNPSIAAQLFPLGFITWGVRVPFNLPSTPEPFCGAELLCWRSWGLPPRTSGGFLCCCFVGWRWKHRHRPKSSHFFCQTFWHFFFRKGSHRFFSKNHPFYGLRYPGIHVSRGSFSQILWNQRNRLGELRVSDSARGLDQQVEVEAFLRVAYVHYGRIHQRFGEFLQIWEKYRISPVNSDGELMLAGKSAC